MSDVQACDLERISCNPTDVQACQEYVDLKPFAGQACENSPRIIQRCDRGILGFYRDNGKENGNYFNGVI